MEVMMSIARSFLMKITLLSLLSCIVPVKCKADWLKLGAAGLGSIVAYKVGSNMLFGQSRPEVKKCNHTSYLDSVDKGLNVATKLGILAGAFLVFDKFFLNSKLAAKLAEAKQEIKQHVTDKIKNLKKYVKKRFNQTDKKIDQLEGKIDELRKDTKKIKKTTEETNRLVKKGRG